MSWLLILALLGLCLLASALYSGSETAFYSVSKVQLDLDAERGSRTARWARWLSKDDAGLLIVILIGNNLMIELATHLGESLGVALGASHDASAVAVGFWLSPLAFFFAELLPKEMFRRRPHGLLPLPMPLLMVSRFLFWPLERLLRVITAGVEYLCGVQAETADVLHGREGWQARFEEVRRAGVVNDRTYRLMRNAMTLRSTPVTSAMLPWDQVVALRMTDTPEQQWQGLRQSRYSRLPVLDAEGRVLGYLHQLDVMARRAGESSSGGLRALGRDMEDEAQPDPKDLLAGRVDVPVLDPKLSVSEALLTLKGLGKRAAVVGSLDQPLGWVTLKDLVEELTGDLVGL